MMYPKANENQRLANIGIRIFKANILLNFTNLVEGELEKFPREILFQILNYVVDLNSTHV